MILELTPMDKMAAIVAFVTNMLTLVAAPVIAKAVRASTKHIAMDAAILWLVNQHRVTAIFAKEN
jgi:hypothetical protein